ncbi:hypothetical protein [Streptomyces anulatus]|uniref:hypothetical protein n=1 Tax=Streptomyces anulatus TaxID=1892 RepID=UPI00225170D7|nr:hypothetical protein [Streptomyces anulatus]MCX4506706.1 hypothetical protein [Streptomyces anulatus]
MSENLADAAVSDSTTAEQVPPGSTVITSHFKLIFLSVLALTVFSLCGSLAIALLIDKPSEAAKAVADTCLTIAQMGFGAMVGLLGGRAA